MSTAPTNILSWRICRSSRGIWRPLQCSGAATRVASQPASIGELLDRLGVPRGGVVYAQTSVDWVQRAGFAAADVLAGLGERTGAGGTLVMPSYPFQSTHLEYLTTAPVFDVRKTPATIGLLPEIFRRTSGVLRSLDPDFCVAALGPDARAIVSDAPAEGDPFGPESSYQRMIDVDATFVGLGVTLNTCSFIHVIDSHAKAGYPAAVYETPIFQAKVIDARGQAREVPRLALRPEFQRLTSPSSIVTAMRPSAATFTELQINGAQFFRWRLKPWAEWCLAHARSLHGTGEWPCWLTRLTAPAQ
jgi:aminoglycoside N3'-acetyltransferase